MQVLNFLLLPFMLEIEPHWSGTATQETSWFFNSEPCGSLGEKIRNKVPNLKKSEFWEIIRV